MSKAISDLTFQELILSLQNFWAQQTGRSKTYYMLEAIARHLDELEDLYLAEQRVIEHRASGQSAVSLAELMREFEVNNPVVTDTQS